jgi:glutathione S-transferase
VGDRIRVWGVGTARTFRVHWILHELGLDYDVEAIQSRTGESQTEAYLALNPRGKIPLLEHDGLVLAESAAIALYLADRFGEGQGLIPAFGTRERAVHDQWCYFAMTELDATSLYVVRRHADLSDVYGEAPAAVASSYAYFQRQASVADAELADGRSHLLGDAFTVADVLLTTCLVWAHFLGQVLPAHLDAYRQRTTARASYAPAFAANFPPAVLAAMRAQAEQGGSA